MSLKSVFKHLLPRKKIDLDLLEFIEKQTPVFWVTGPPFSGKTTLSYMLAECSKYHLIKLSRLITLEAMKSVSARTSVLRNCLDHGKPIPDDIVVNIIKEEIINTCATADGYIIDGFPINVKQGKTFKSKICKVDIVICLSLKLDAMLTRIFFHRADMEINFIRCRHIKWCRRMNAIKKKYEYKFINLPSVYPCEDTCTALLITLEDDWGYKFQRLYTK